MPANKRTLKTLLTGKSAPETAPKPVSASIEATPQNATGSSSWLDRVSTGETPGIKREQPPAGCGYKRG